MREKNERQSFPGRAIKQRWGEGGVSYAWHLGINIPPRMHAGEKNVSADEALQGRSEGVNGLLR